MNEAADRCPSIRPGGTPILLGRAVNLMFYVPVEGGEIYYEVCDLVAPWRRDSAAGPRTILFHHGIGLDGQVWAEWLPVLADA